MRSPWVLVSVVSHSLAITAAVIAPLVASVDLPEVHSPLPAYVAAFAKDIDLPPPAPSPRPHGIKQPSADPNLPPAEVPNGIREESPRSLIENSGPGVEGGLQPIGEIPGAHVNDFVVPPAPPSAPERKPFRVSDVQRPRKIVDVAPVYPTIAINVRKEGVVILEAIIDTRGYVTDVHVVRSIPLLDEAAIDAVRQWRYTPTMINGEPVPVIITVTVNFTLSK